MEFKEFTGKTVAEAITEASVALGTTSDKIEYEVVEEGSSGLLGLFSKNAVIRAKCKDTLEDKVREFLSDVLEKMEMPADLTLEIDEEEKVISIAMDGENAGDLIGKRGVNLDALQYLVSIVANKEADDYYRIKLDAKDFRERRQKTLENLAKNVASKVKKTRRKVVLEPMNPYERRVIHSYLQPEKNITTKSEGEEPNRRVVVFYKR
ncbi:MAG: protein jag [Erysipelotrichaceae bacterium]|nr:protein jag [Erysipelotrichaceae bacterium]